MYLHRIVLEHIRGFELLDFTPARPDDSYAGWTVFTGDNGSGKSSLLKAIAVGLIGRDTARALQPSFNRWVYHGAPKAEGSIQLEIVRVDADDDLANQGGRPEVRFPAKISLKNNSRETALQAAVPAKKSASYRTPDRTIWSPDAPGWFSCGYGPFRRIFGASSEATQTMVASSTARFATMFQEAASLAEADRWLRELQFKALENRQAEREQLELLLELLNDDLMPNQLRVARVDSAGLWLVDRNGIELAWGEMSDGYRAIIALLVDIVRHMIEAYTIKGLTAHNTEGQLYINRSGVILIDEVDAHLHPEWQRELGFWLKRRFPKIQFLVTTHSPIICQAADPNGLFVLPEPGSGQPPRALSTDDYNRVIASRPDTILLTPAFGLQNTRSPEAVEARSDYAHLQAKQRVGGKLSAHEQAQLKRLELFVLNDEEL
jgi:energy-coupling factor transporter ATP-binding protein EcfA2